MYRLADVPLTEAVKMMTATPARVLGVNDRIGSVAPGMDADLLLFDEEISVSLVMTKGKVWMK